MAKKRNSELASSLLYIIIGVLLIVFPGEALNWGMTLAGIFFLVSGVIDVCRKNWMGGAISLIIGAVILVLGWTAVSLVLLVLGILIAVKGVLALIGTLTSKRGTVISVLFALLTVAVGILLAFGHALPIMVMVGGVLLVINGVLGLFGSRR